MSNYSTGHGPKSGRSTVDYNHGRAALSLEFTPSGDSKCQTSPQLHRKIEELEVMLTTDRRRW
jgi:hypothetical protein